MGQHTFIVLNILTSASPMLFVTFQGLISFRGEYWPVCIETSFPCIPTIYESEEGGVLIREGALV